MVMELKTYSELLAQPELLKNEHISALKSIIKEYPYFQSARALHLKGLKNQDSFRYNNELKVTASYTSDRAVLFDFITSEKFEETQEDIHLQISQKISEEEPVLIQESVPEVAKELDLGKPIEFSPRETHSFNEWLQLSTRKPIVREEKKTLDKFDIIDRFIENNPKIIPVDKGEKVQVEIPKNKDIVSGTTLIIENLRDWWSEAMIKRVYRYALDVIQPFPISKKKMVNIIFGLKTIFLIRLQMKKSNLA